ncbi:MAG TPA: putative glycoside hydrolase [Candidatus Angelobacter sp.]|nr:putative glycoside hydrolase [Candidatus Angelobacter sp.]
MAPRKFTFASTAVLIVAGLVVLSFVFTRHGHLVSEAQASPARQTTANSAATPAASASAQQLPPGTITYQAKAYTTAQFLARNHLTESKYMTVAEYVDAIAADNNGKKTFKRGDTVLIPGIEPQPIVEKIRPFPKDGEARAIYMTGDTAGSAYGIDLVRRWHEAGGNAVVFDIKDSDGTINIPFQHPLARKLSHYPISNLPKYVRFLHSMGMHVIARQALFRDNNIAQNHTELAVQSRSLHRPWLENGKQVWADPSNKEVQDYNLALAKYVAQSGVDEIQFDYVRFPAEGNQPDAQFAFEKNPKLHRDDVIAAFLDRAYSELHPMGVLVSIDVFGVMAWQRKVDLNHTGQDIVKMAKHCDVISPMIYPSHFFGMDGYKDPGDAPEHFISVSMDRYVKVTAGSGVTIRPWLQAFHWRTKTYSPEYILTQVRTSNQHGGIGFLFWNAANNYSKPFDAMPVIMKNAKEYLHTPTVTVAQNTASRGAAQGVNTAAAPSGAGQPH